MEISLRRRDAIKFFLLARGVREDQIDIKANGDRLSRGQPHGHLDHYRIAWLHMGDRDVGYKQRLRDWYGRNCSPLAKAGAEQNCPQAKKQIDGFKSSNRKPAP